MNSGASAFPADAYTNLHYAAGLASEYDNVLTLRIEIPCKYLYEPSFAAGSFNKKGR
jgi:hypothetical protein